MGFNPLDPMTWHDDPDDYVVPAHEMESIALAQHLTTQADADEEAHVRAFLGLDRMNMTEEDKEECLRQVMESRKAIQDALERLKEAEDALDEHDVRAMKDSDAAMNMTDDDVAEEMRRRAGWDQEEI